MSSNLLIKETNVSEKQGERKLQYPVPLSLNFNFCLSAHFKKLLYSTKTCTVLESLMQEENLAFSAHFAPSPQAVVTATSLQRSYYCPALQRRCHSVQKGFGKNISHTST